MRTNIYLQIEEAGVEAGTQGQDLDSLSALRRKMSVEVLQELPEGEDSREVTCKTNAHLAPVPLLSQKPSHASRMGSKDVESDEIISQPARGLRTSVDQGGSS